MAKATKGAVYRGKSVNKTELADLFGVTAPTVDGWVRAGCPMVSRGARGVASEFNTADVAKWLREKARDEGAGTAQADEGELRRRKLLAETERAELDLAKAKGEVAPLDQVERMVSRAFSEVRAGMRNLPSRLVASLIGETDERKFKRVMLEEIDQVLEALANAELAEDDEEEDEDDE